MELHKVTGHALTVDLPSYVCLALSRACRAAELFLSGCQPEKAQFGFPETIADTETAVAQEATLYGVLAAALEALALTSYQHGYIAYKRQADASLESLQRVPWRPDQRRRHLAAPGSTLGAVSCCPAIRRTAGAPAR